MTVLWSLIGLISLVVCAIVIWTLTRRDSQRGDLRADFDLTVYKDQLAEVDRDRDRGVLSEDQAAAARTEIERRILALAATAEADDETQPESQGFSATSLLVALAVPTAALAMYVTLGAPMVPNVPYVQRNIAAEQKALADQRRAGEMNDLAERLAERMAKEPDNLQGWMLLGRSYSALNRDQDAVGAMRKAFELAPFNPSVLVQYAEVLIVANKNTVSEQAKSMLERALGQDRRNPRARYYLALALAQAKNVRGALQGWIDLAALAGPDAPWLASVHQQIAAAAKDLGVDPATIKPSAEARALGPPAAAPNIPGPSREDVERARKMTAQDRTEMIRGMVQRLADRLEESPDDPDGWRRLAEAYRVLGEDQKAADAEARAQAAER